MRLRMLKSQTGSENGIVVNLYSKDKIYDVCESLYRVFVEQMKIAEPASIEDTVEKATVATEKDTMDTSKKDRKNEQKTKEVKKKE